MTPYQSLRSSLLLQLVLSGQFAPSVLWYSAMRADESDDTVPSAATRGSSSFSQKVSVGSGITTCAPPESGGSSVCSVGSGMVATTWLVQGPPFLLMRARARIL